MDLTQRALQTLVLAVRGEIAPEYLTQDIISALDLANQAIQAQSKRIVRVNLFSPYDKIVMVELVATSQEPYYPLAEIATLIERVAKHLRKYEKEHDGEPLFPPRGSFSEEFGSVDFRVKQTTED